MWRIDVYDLGSQALVATYTPSSPGGIVGSMRWATYPTGETIRIQITAIPSMTTLPSRSYIVLSWQGTPVASGVLLRTWPTWDGHARTYEVAGSRYLMEARLWGPGEHVNVSLTTILSNVLQARHPAIPQPQLLQIPDTVVASLKAEGPVPLSEILDKLLPPNGLRWAILPGWPPNLVIMPTTPVAHTVAYEDGAVEASPHDWTGVPDIVRAAIQTPRDEGVTVEASQYTDTGFISVPARRYVARVISVGGSAGLESSVIVAQPPIVVLQPLQWSRAQDIANPQGATDGNLATYAEGTTMTAFLAKNVVSHLWLMEWWATGNVIPSAGNNAYYPRNVWGFPINNTALTHRQLGVAAYVDPVPSMFAKFDLRTTTSTPARLYEVRIYVLDLSRLENAIRALYTPTALADGADLTYARYVPVADIITVTGSPYGEIRGAVEAADYEISPERGIMSRIRLGRELDLTRDLLRRTVLDLSGTSRLTGGVL